MVYEVVFGNNGQGKIKTSGISLECRNFCKTHDDSPSDRHAYKLKCFTYPIAVGRLPGMAKLFFKYIRYTECVL